MRRAALILAIALASLVAVSAAWARVPPGFVGTVVDGPLYPVTAPGVDISKQMDSMVASGVQSIRVVFDWQGAQPYASWSAVPAAQRGMFTDAGGVPTRWDITDQIVGLAAAHGLRVLPVVLYTPSWDAAPHSPSTFAAPARTAPYAAFLSALVARYGPRGSFWSAGSPRLPIRWWQIWNEPNITTFWPEHPWVPSYVALLRAAHRAIKRADPGAKVVLAGIPNFSWVQLGRLYRVRGVRKLFDVAAVHPYTASPQGVITILQRVRNVMNQAGDTQKPILADEISWPSSQGKVGPSQGFDIGTTERGQARKLAQMLPLLGRERRRLKLIGFDYYTWATTEPGGSMAFDYAGLVRFTRGRFVAKPALAAFRRGALALEGCRQKGPVATVCARPG